MRGRAQELIEIDKSPQYNPAVERSYNILPEIGNIFLDRQCNKEVP